MYKVQNNVIFVTSVILFLQGLRIEKANVEMIAQFQNVTGTDDKVSKYYLESSKDRCGNWNLEDAIASFYKDLGAAQPYVWTAKNHRGK